IADAGSILRDPDRFRVCEFPDARCAELATETGAFYAAERQTRIGGDHRVDKNHSTVQLRCEKFLLLSIFGPHTRAQTKCRIIRKFDGCVGIAYAENRCNRAEDFFAVRW